MNHNNSKKGGFTIIELVVYMGILSILLIIFIDMFALLVNRQLESEGLSAVQQDENYILSRLTYVFGQTNSLVSPIAPGTPSASLRLLIGTEFLDLYASSSSLMASMSGKINYLNSSDTTISNLTFQRLGTGTMYDVVQIKCDISSKVKKQSGYEVTHFSTTLGLREK